MKTQESRLSRDFAYLKFGYARYQYIENVGGKYIAYYFNKEIINLEDLEGVVEIAKGKLKEYEKLIKELKKFNMRINDYFQVTASAQFFDSANNEEYSKELTLDEAMSLSVKDLIDEVLYRFLKFGELKEFGLTISLEFPYLYMYKSLCHSRDFNCVNLEPVDYQFFNIRAIFGI